MRRKQNYYIFAPEKPKRGGTGCLILLLAVLFAAVVLSLLTNAAMNQRIDLKTEKVRVMSLDKKYENFTVLHISDLHGDERGLDCTMIEIRNDEILTPGGIALWSDRLARCLGAAAQAIET